MNQKDLYYVAVKLFLRDGDKLLITHDIFGDWDLPGGRIRINEFDTPLPDVVARKVVEELGPDARYKLGEPKAFFRVARREHDQGGQEVHIFAVGYEAQYLGGELTMGDHHDQLEWVDVHSVKPEVYFTGGWLKGVQDYLALVRAA